MVDNNDFDLLIFDHIIDNLIDNCVNVVLWPIVQLSAADGERWGWDQDLWTLTTTNMGLSLSHQPLR